MYNNNQVVGRELDWNDTIEHDSSNEFVILPAGEYPFEVVSYERGRHQGSEKLPACNKVVLSIKVTDPSTGQSTTIQDNLFLHTITEGFLCEFFTAIGQRKHGEQLRMNWQTVSGSKGHCKISVRNWTGDDGEVRQSNQIKKYLEPKENPNNTPSFTPGRF